MLYVSTLYLNPRCRDTWLDLYDCQQMHCRVMSAFPTGPGNRAAHGVLYRIDWPSGVGPVRVTVQSRTQPDWRSLCESGYIIRAETGTVTCQYPAGAVLPFRLRAFPSRAICTKSLPDGTKSKGRRVPLRTDEERLLWLSRKASQAGFAVREARVDGMTEVGGLHPRGQLSFVAVEFSGELQVLDPGLFAEAMAAGIGRAKAYGHGLLLVGPAT